MNSSKYLCFFSTDEKERFDPSQFQESIVQGLNQSGTDLEAVTKFLDASGAKLDYRRYAETLFDILVAGGMLGKRQDSFVFVSYIVQLNTICVMRLIILRKAFMFFIPLCNCKHTIIQSKLIGGMKEA